MALSDKQFFEFHLLLDCLFENQASADDVHKIQDIIRREPEAERYYFSYVELKSGLHILESLDCDSFPSPESIESMMLEFAEYEKNAPRIDLLDKDCHESELPPLIRPSREKQRLSKIGIFGLISGIAAILFVVALPVLIPFKPRVEVATVVDQMNVVWANSACKPQGSNRLLTNCRPFELKKGYVEIKYDQGAIVVVEAPSSFQILSDDRMKLHYGKLYATVGQEAVGFTVDTPSASIIDLGTEFGIESDMLGNTYLHMMKGEASLVVGDKDSKATFEITKGAAKKVSGSSHIVRDIICDKQHFIRAIDSNKKVAWRKAPSLDLADIVGGGNGFGTGTIGSAIDPRTGEKFLLSDVTEWGPFDGTNSYSPVLWSEFIDGVFVPDGENGAIPVSSSGDKFVDCPNTENMFWAGISNGGRLPEPLEEPAKALQFDDSVYGTKMRPGVFMHSNLGITFDLAAIRKANPDVKFTEFRADCGICDNGPGRLPYADFWVIVDGKLCFSKREVTTGTVHKIVVPIDERDRYLTLVTTDGGKKVCFKLEDGLPIPFDSDWCIFAHPELMIERE